MDSIGKAGVPHPHHPPHVPDKNCPEDAPGMRGHRHRDKDGRLEQKRGDTHLSSLEEKYGEMSSRPYNTHLSELRQLTGEVGIDKVKQRLKAMEQVVSKHTEPKARPAEEEAAQVPKFLADLD